MPSPPDHSDVGAYLLGVLNEADTIAFEEHLAQCPRCQEELQEMLDLPDLLDAARALDRQRNGHAPGTPPPRGRPLRAVPPPGGPQQVPPRAAPPRPGGPPRALPPQGAPPRPVQPAPVPPPSAQPPRAQPVPAPAAGPPEDRVLTQLLGQVEERKRRRRTSVWLLAGAAAVLLVGTPLVISATSGGTGGGTALPSTILDDPGRPTVTTTAPPPGPGPSGEPGPPATETLTGENPANNVSARLALAERGSGVAVDLELKGISGPRLCQLVAVGKAGQTFPVNSWIVPEKGYGVAGSPEPLRTGGTVALSRGDIARFEVRTMDGIGLLSIPAG